MAETASLAKQAAHLVEIKYEELKPILTIDDAIAANSFYDHVESIERGEIDEETFKLNDSDDLIHEGRFETGAQEHFYLEPLACLIIPKRESDEIEIISTTQDPNEIQHKSAEILGLPRNRIVSRSKRLGGGFGGKETHSGLIVFPCLVAARKFSRPIRCVFERDVDMMVTGKRHPFRGNYKCRVSRGDGVIKAYQLELISNGGYCLEVSHRVMYRAVNHSDNVYNIPNIQVTGRIAKTNIASNTGYLLYLFFSR